MTGIKLAVAFALDLLRPSAIMFQETFTGIKMLHRFSYRSLLMVVLIVLQTQSGFAAVHLSGQLDAAEVEVSEGHCHQQVSEPKHSEKTMDCCDGACTMMACHMASAALNTFSAVSLIPSQASALGFFTSSAPTTLASSLFRPPIIA